MTEPLPAVEELVGLMPHAVAMGITIDRATAAGVLGSVAWAPDRCTVGGVLHGGVLMTLADSVGAVCAYLNLPARQLPRSSRRQTSSGRFVPALRTPPADRCTWAGPSSSCRPI